MDLRFIRQGDNGFQVTISGSISLLGPARLDTAGRESLFYVVRDPAGIQGAVRTALAVVTLRVGVIALRTVLASKRNLPA